ncbi:MAG: flagellar biosynthesis protein FlhA [Halobacteriovoraceae bacterium]|nr:flagellar biosynthesis protein FlhA [Halobacteriovoraceae bacterium]
MNEILGRFRKLASNSDWLIAAGLFGILIVLMVPIHPIVLDLLLALSLAFAVVVLLVSVYVKKPLDFSTFPTILLVMTLFRLSLNVATTRNILLDGGSDGTGAAGEIINSFGKFVVGGNYVVGIIIFIIFVIINFIVITKGAGRVAEVAARFTLDAMPGKQMAIDADLNAGLIDEAQAKKRRQEVGSEAEFYGSMDGASKFVRGDAIAGILIAVINILGGILVGVAQNGLSAAEAAETFTLLTVGDGLVSQIPALIISISAGIIAPRNTDDDSLGLQVTRQFKVHPKAMFIAATILGVFGLIPGLPKFPFFSLCLALLVTAYYIDKGNKQEEDDFKARQVDEKKATPDNLEELLSLELVELEVGYGLVNLVDAEQNGDLLERITHIRKQFALDWGVIIPSIRIKDNLELKPGGYSVKIKGIEVAKGELVSDHFLAMDPGSVIEKMDGIETVEPVFGLPAVWISEEQKEDAQYNGYTVVDLSTVVATHLTEILKSNLHELFGRQELVRIMENFKEDYPKIVSDLVPDILTLGTILKVMQNLLREGVSVRDLRTILETMSEYGVTLKEADGLTELVRQNLYRTITEGIRGEAGDIPLFTLDRGIEENIAGNLIQTEKGQELSLDPKITQTILASLNEKIEEATTLGEKMVVLCSPVIRNHFKKLTEKFIPNLIVVSHNEISSDANIRSLGTVRL